MRSLEEHSNNNAMSEIALALAMAFFSIMVMTLVSMGAGGKAAGAKMPATDDGFRVRTAETAPPSDPSDGAERAPLDEIIIHYQGRFMDGRLRTIDPAELPVGVKRYLAVDPNLPMVDTVKARARLKSDDVTVVTLDKAWLETLQKAGGQ